MAWISDVLREAFDRVWVGFAGRGIGGWGRRMGVGRWGIGNHGEALL